MKKRFIYILLSSFILLTSCKYTVSILGGGSEDTPNKESVRRQKLFSGKKRKASREDVSSRGRYKNKGDNEKMVTETKYVDGKKYTYSKKSEKRITAKERRKENRATKKYRKKGKTYSESKSDRRYLRQQRRAANKDYVTIFGIRLWHKKRR